MQPQLRLFSRNQMSWGTCDNSITVMGKVPRYLQPQAGSTAADAIWWRHCLAQDYKLHPYTTAASLQYCSTSALHLCNALLLSI